METKVYEMLGEDWKEDQAYNCCNDNENETPSGCDCCYDNWNKELRETRLNYSKVSEESRQISEKYKFITQERDKFKSWFDDLIKADQLVNEVCDQFEVITAQTEKICTNSEKSVKAIEILFCMVRDLFEQVDYLVTIYNQIDNCIKCLNREELPENSGIRKCLKAYFDKLDALIKTRNELIKALMKVVRDANVLHEGICSEFGMRAVISEWLDILNCEEDCGAVSNPPVDPCKQQVPETQDQIDPCALLPIMTFPICNDSYYQWVKQKYNDDVKAADDAAKKLVEINKRKEAISACQTSLISALKEVDPKELCKQ
jgi:hypothetical protein